MTYEGMLKEFGTRAMYSADHCNWSGNWDSNSFAPDDLPERVAFEGTHKVSYEGWDKDYSETLSSPTYREVLEFMDRAMNMVDDHHHSFFEGLYIKNDTCHIVAGS